MSPVPDAEPESGVWERRVARERTARRQAERTAERGMRELWLANQSLERRVQERTDLLERVRLLDMRIMRERLAAVRRMTGPAMDAAALAFLEIAEVGEGTGAPWRSKELAEEVLRRWQLPAARRGLLLVASVADDEQVDGDTAQQLLVGVDAVVGFAVGSRCRGSLPVDFQLGPTSVEARLAVPANSATTGDEPLFALVTDLLRHLPGMVLSTCHHDGDSIEIRFTSQRLHGADETGREQPIGA